MTGYKRPVVNLHWAQETFDCDHVRTKVLKTNWEFSVDLKNNWKITANICIIGEPKLNIYQQSRGVNSFLIIAAHLILYVCSQWEQPLKPGSHSMVTANVSFLVTVTLLGAWGVVFSITSIAPAVRVATSLWTWVWSGFELVYLMSFDENDHQRKHSDFKETWAGNGLEAERWGLWLLQQRGRVIRSSVSGNSLQLRTLRTLSTQTEQFSAGEEKLYDHHHFINKTHFSLLTLPSWARKPSNLCLKDNETWYNIVCCSL